MIEQRIFFFDGPKPKWGTQSSPVFYRHMLRAAKNRRVIWVHNTDDGIDEPAFQYFRIPHRSPFWPPVRTWLPGSKTLRSFLVYRRIKFQYGIGNNDIVLSCLSGGSPFLSAAAVAQLSGAKLAMFFHDMWPDGGNLSRQIKEAIPKCDVILCVSDALKEVAIEFGARKARVLLPIGGDKFELSKRAYSNRVVIGIAGSSSAAAISLARKLGDEVIAICRPMAAIGTGAPITFVDPFPNNDDAVRFVSSNCSHFMVLMPDNLSAYGKYAFPSKLVDFSRAGVPVIIVADPETTVAKWGRARGWPMLFSENDVEHRLVEIAALLRNPGVVEQVADLTLRCAENEFSADKIHGAFELALHMSSSARAKA